MPAVKSRMKTRARQVFDFENSDNFFFKIRNHSCAAAFAFSFARDF